MEPKEGRGENLEKRGEKRRESISRPGEEKTKKEPASMNSKPAL